MSPLLSRYRCAVFGSNSPSFPEGSARANSSELGWQSPTLHNKVMKKRIRIEV